MSLPTSLQFVSSNKYLLGHTIPLFRRIAITVFILVVDALGSTLWILCRRVLVGRPSLRDRKYWSTAGLQSWVKSSITRPHVNISLGLGGKPNTKVCHHGKESIFTIPLSTIYIYSKNNYTLYIFKLIKKESLQQY